jgi:predicted DCC family thiol-disulfide oxidoreductase YuxK
MLQQEPIVVFFDGYCGLCNRSVNFLLRIDKYHQLRFCTLQSDFAKIKLAPFISVVKEVDSVVGFQNQQIYLHADAIFLFLKNMPAGWKYIGYLGSIIPSFIATPIYKFIAKNRYRWWGKNNYCRVPTSEEAAYFLN